MSGPGRTTARTSTRGIVVTDAPRPARDAVTALAEHGVATVHEAIGRTGCLGPDIRPVWPGARVAGSAVTVLCWPGDNTMIHVAVEQCSPGDILVVATNSPNRDGLFGELFATSLSQRGVVGAVLACGARDIAELHTMRFPVWSSAVSAQGSVKETLGSVNVPVVIAGQLIRPGDVVVADDDGVVCVPREHAEAAVRAAADREEREEATRAAFRAGELGLDRYAMRLRLTDLGLRYVGYDEEADS